MKFSCWYRIPWRNVLENLCATWLQGAKDPLRRKAGRKKKVTQKISPRNRKIEEEGNGWAQRPRKKTLEKGERGLL